MASAGRRTRGKAAAGRLGRILRRIGPRRAAAGAGLLLLFGSGFYLAQLYGDIAALIEQRRQALTSAVYSAPLRIARGDDLTQLHLFDRLERLSYSRVTQPGHPGEYALIPGRVTIYLRSFREGIRERPAALVHLTLAGATVEGVADSFGTALPEATLEPEVIGRLLPGAPPERVEVQLNDLPPYLVRGLLATEDRYFYYHPGFDPVRMVEAAIADLRSHRLAQGASTLTQQLARTFIDRRERTFTRKVRELAVALVIEIRLSKKQILERYINDVPMGAYDGTPIVGLPLAARYFFNKDLHEVTPGEAAILIGMIQAPSLYDPRRHPDACRARRDIVLAVMRRAGAIDGEQYAQAVAQPILIARAPGLRRAPYFTDYVISEVERIPGFNGNLAGLKVYTTLDPEMQQAATESVQSNLERLEKQHPHLRRQARDERLEGSLLALDARSGAILAMVGGRDYSASQFNRVTQAERQPGSAFKPIVYLTALDPARAPNGHALTLASLLPDRPMSFNGWTPVNYERTYQGTVTVVEALVESLNVPTAYVGSLLGPPSIVATAHEMGIDEDLPAVLPISIGAAETTLLELTGAYQAFAAAGVSRPPYALEAVYDANDHLIYQHAPRQLELMSPQVAYLITGALEQVLKWGTGAGAIRMGLDFPAAGKTGTTQDFHDAYFIGYTPRVVCGVWVGFDHPQSLGASGAAAALPAWVSFMLDVTPPASPGFKIPSGISMAAIDPQSGGLATGACPRTAMLPFLEGTAPTQICPLHGGLTAPPPTLVAGGGATSPSSPDAAASPGAEPTPARNGVMGAIGSFLGSLFGH
ncbi:MAG TPA: transglycosylase domain-containing protein [Candidatus Binataceae bacterium]|nr:transglycosylase domain-containing protein [Candidatus Binataceae bacterium]